MLNTFNKILSSTSVKVFNEQQAAAMAKKLAYRIKHRKKFEKLKAKKMKARQMKNDRKNERIAIVGRSRYYLSHIFGQWILFI